MKQPNRLELIDICCRIVSEGPVTLEERIWMTKLCEKDSSAKRIADDIMDLLKNRGTIITDD
jgi:hypothetical protein|tara:strand:+ start:2211 stop:2396 length:186 start_codon:yes stop_codon:yes gene_type:complete